MFKFDFQLFAICLIICNLHLVQANDEQVGDDDSTSNVEPQGLLSLKISDRKCSLLKNKYLSDVNLIAVDKKDDQEETIEAIPAHKLILEYSSPVFERAFNDSNNFLPSLNVEHISLETLDILLKFIYCNQTSVTNKQIVNVLEAAKFYELHELTNHLSEQLLNEISYENVFDFFKYVHQFQYPIIRKKIIDLVQRRTDDIFRVYSFEKLDKSIVEFILNQPMLKIDENRLFDLLLDWTRNQAQQVHHNPSVNDLRQTMGDLLYLIRIPSMDSKIFMDGSAKSQIFTQQEVMDILSYQLSSSKPVNGIVSNFKSLKRRFSKTIKVLAIESGSSVYQHNPTVMKLNQTRFLLNSEFDFCLTEVMMFSKILNLNFKFTISDDEDKPILTTKFVLVENAEENGTNYCKVDLAEDCFYVKAHTNFNYAIQFEPTNIRVYRLPINGIRHVTNTDQGKITIEANDEYIPDFTHFLNLNMFKF